MERGREGERGRERERELRTAYKSHVPRWLAKYYLQATINLVSHRVKMSYHCEALSRTAVAVMSLR
jgi:hypothetical protein